MSRIVPVPQNGAAGMCWMLARRGSARRHSAAGAKETLADAPIWRRSRAVFLCRARLWRSAWHHIVIDNVGAEMAARGGCLYRRR